MAISDIEQWCQDRSATMVFWAEGTNFQALKSWADGDELTATNLWSDESGNGNNASPLNDTSTNRPIYRDGSTTEIGLNNKPAIEFTGDAADSEGVSTGTVVDTSAMPYTLLCVHRARHYSTVRPIHDGVDPDQAAFGWPKTEGADIAHFDVGVAGGGPSPEEDVTSTPIIGPIAECITYDSSITAFFNGSQMATSRTDLPSNTNTGLVLGSKNESGTQVTMDGWIAFAAVLPGAISDADRRRFFAWATRYGCVDGSGGPQERWEYHKADEISGAGVLSYTSTPVQGDVLICKLSTSVPTTTATEADHEVRDTNSSGAMWTQAEGLNHVDGVGSASIWYKVAGASEPTDVWVSNIGASGSGNTSAEIQAVSGLTGNVLQTNSDSVTGTATTETVVLTGNATPGSWLSALVFHDANPGTVTNITGGWGGHVDEVRRITADKVATALDTQSGTFTWTTADETGFVVVEFEPEPTSASLEVVFDDHEPASWDGADWTFDTVGTYLYEPYTPTTGSGVRVDTDISDWTLRRGRSDELRAVNAGSFTATIVDKAVNDVSGNTAAGKWAINNLDATYSHFRRNVADANFHNTHLGATVSVYAVVNGFRTQLFKGKISSWQDGFIQKESIRTSTFTATDGVAELARRQLSGGIMRNPGLTALSGTATHNNSTDTWTLVDHGLFPQDVVELTGTVPTGYTINTPYWVISVDGNVIGNPKFTESNDLWTLTNHGLSNNQAVSFTRVGDGPTDDFEVDVEYTVTNVDGHTFQLVGPDSQGLPITSDQDSVGTWTLRDRQDTFKLSATKNGTVVDGTAGTASATVNLATTPPTFSRQPVGDRIAAILDCVNIKTGEQIWPGSGRTDADRAIDLGDTDIQPSDEQANVWSMLNLLAQSEFSPGIFVGRTGKLQFLGRFTSRNSSGVTFGTTSDTIVKTWAAPDDFNRVFNQVSFYRKDDDGVLGGVPEKAESAASQAVFGIREFDRSNLMIATDSYGDTVTKDMAEFFVDTYAHDSSESFGEQFFSPIEVYLQRMSHADKLAVLAIDIGDTVVVENGANDITEVVNSISMRGRPGDAWHITYGCTRAWDLPGSNAKIDSGTVDSAPTGATIGMG